ncbi:asparagine synthase (glutamine-hydrolyzing) [Metallumcola ferriviriculae]|uniref:asparagine synthase (glutamine-hydrolyzing) n=1 Tax=Metallumcola ferriviriculae TaxID=3039180 RepID=A0AAU0URX7_9FIRM|nr:asparagine synthase (glutamine-hydrolyzing) [Desulfitibacteraceae bacterium MK1]
MCGIAGWVDWQKNLLREKNVLQKMGDTLNLRGPDDAGVWLSLHCGLVHRRLVVIDPEGGKQPMTRYLGPRAYTLVYNGELYNTEDLRRQLLQRGYRFSGHSDTEVLLLSFLEWGPECVEHFNGIFAFALWDDTEESLFLARDRLGVKPLFFKTHNGGLLFGSELKSILAHPEVKPQVDSDGLAEVIALGPARTPGHGVFKGIDELKPGTWLFFSRQGIKQQQYWQLQSKEHHDSLPQTIETVRHLLTDAVERQLVSDVPVCTLLSGGLDSSGLSAIAAKYYQKHNRKTLNTYSVDYVNNDKHFHANEFQPNSDSPWIPLVANYLGTKHHDIQLDTPELASSLSDALMARDLPGMTDIDSSLYLFCKEIKQDATVALSGECADEIFGGYPWFYRQEALNAETFPWMRMQHRRLSFFSPSLIKKIKASDYLYQRYQAALQETPTRAEETLHETKMRQMLYLTLTRWMPTLLDRKDRMSMAVGLEVRVPYCDHRLVEYAWNIPWEMKNHGGHEKGILRSALEGLLPLDVIYRKKSPYPKTYNPSYLKAVSLKVDNILQDPSSPILPLINEKAVRSLIDEDARQINLPWFGQLMSGPQMLAFLIQLDLWLRHYDVELI